METQIVISESYIENKDKYRRTKHMVGISMWEFEWKPKYAYCCIPLIFPNDTFFRFFIF